MQRRHSTHDLRGTRWRLGCLTLLLLFGNAPAARAALRPARATQPSQLPAEAPLLDERQVGRSLDDRLRQMRQRHELKRQERREQQAQGSESIGRRGREESEPALRREPVPLPMRLLPASDD